jgi:Tol biopolymer transport system component
VSRRLLQITSLDRAAGGLVLTLGVIIIVLIFLVSQLGVRVRADFADNQIGPFSPLQLSFSVPVNPKAVEPLLTLDPEAAGRFEWLNSKTMRFLPTSPLRPDTIYKLQLGPGKVGENGEGLRNHLTWSFSIRPPTITYLAFPGGKSEIWITDKEGTSPHRLFEFATSIFDFDASPNGEFIVFSAFNAQKGLDLWMVDRKGESPAKLLDCGTGRCSTPSISPDSARVAYTRQAPGLTPSDAPGAPRIYMIDLQNKQDRPLFEDSQLLGYGPRWSPNGKWISSYDSLQDVIRVVSLETGKQVLLPSVIGTYLSWSPDNNRLAFTNVEKTPSGLRTVINIADFETGKVDDLLGLHDLSDFGYAELAWSPVDTNQLLMGMRPNPDQPAVGLWLIDLTTLGGPAIADTEGLVCQAPSWDAWGKSIVFQQFQLGQAASSEISFWQSGMDQPRVLAQGLSPCWLP